MSARRGQKPMDVGESPSMNVIESVAAFKGVDVSELDSIYSVIDPDALDALFAETDTVVRTGHVEFLYEGCRVIVDSDRNIQVTDILDPDEE